MAFPYPPRQINLEIEQGTTYQFNQLVFDTTTNLPLNLTNFIAEFTAKESYAHTEILVGIVVTCDAQGVHFTIDPAKTLDLTWDRGYYKIQATDTIGLSTTTLFEGLLLVKP